MILEKYYDEFWMKMKITYQYISSNLIFYLKYILVYLYKLKTTKDKDFWFKEFSW